MKKTCKAGPAQTYPSTHLKTLSFDLPETFGESAARRREIIPRQRGPMQEGVVDGAGVDEFYPRWAGFCLRSGSFPREEKDVAAKGRIDKDERVPLRIESVCAVFT